MDINETLQRVFHRALGVLDSGGWQQDMLGSPFDPCSPHCTVGATMVAVELEFEDLDKAARVVLTAEDYLKRFLPPQFQKLADEEDPVGSWNDDDCTTEEDVRLLFKQAITQLEEEAAHGE